MHDNYPGTITARRERTGRSRLTRPYYREKADNTARMSGGSEGERARRSCSPLDPLVGRSEVEASQRIRDPRGVGAPPQRSANKELPA